MSDLILRALTGQEPDIEQLLDDIDAVLQAAYRAPSWKFRVQRFLRVQPGGWVVARQENEVVAVGGCIAYPDAGFGWIGLIATSPSSQRHGAGRTVTQWAVDHLKSLGCASVLDASLAGAPLYVRMGFDDVGVSVLMEPSVVPIRSGTELVTTITRTDGPQGDAPSRANTRYTAKEPGMPRADGSQGDAPSRAKSWRAGKEAGGKPFAKRPPKKANDRTSAKPAYGKRKERI